MLNKNKKSKLFGRRVLALGAIKGTLFVTLIGRLYYLQIVKSKEYKTYSDSNRIKLALIPPLRGQIHDRKGNTLAGNKNFYRVMFDPEIADDEEIVINKLADVLGVNDSKRQSMLTKYKNRVSRQPIAIYEHLKWNEVARVEVNAPDLPGVSIDVGQIRDFPTGEASSHLVGYMGPVSEKEITKNPLLNHPDFKIGRYGIEQVMESKLRGQAGVRRMEVNAHGLTIRELSRENSVQGDNVKLTISRPLQEFVGKRMQGLSGCAIIMDVRNGDILSLVSTPGFDPNEFTYGVSHQYWRELMENDKTPLINKAISNQYPPGSTFKPIVALAALKGGVDPNEKINCPGYMVLGRRRFHCWKEEGHGRMNMRQAIMHSCNTYFFTMANRIGIEAIDEMAIKFGMGKKVGIILPGEKSGLMPNKEWLKKKYNATWQGGDTLNVGIGQGYVLSTPLQLVSMTAKIANSKIITPNLILSDEPPVAQELDVPKKHMEIIRDGMRMVMNVPGGTAYGSRIRDSKFQVAGKTGTSQVISKKGLEDTIANMTPEEIEKTKNHALFIGYGSVDDPRYAVAVVVEHGGGGSAAAAPVARDILDEARKIMEPG